MTINLSDLTASQLTGPIGPTGPTGPTGDTGPIGPSGTLLNSSGALANSVMIANSTGYTSNTANLTFSQSNNTLYVANTIAVNNLVYASNGLPISTGGGGGGSISVTDDTTTVTTHYPLLGIVTTGTLSIANTSSTKLYFTPSTGTLNATVFNSLSDENEKNNIQIIPNALRIVENLNGVTFEYNSGGKSSAGLIAQDVEKWLPQLVDNEDGIKSLNYNGIIGVLVEAVKTLSDRIKILESR